LDRCDVGVHKDHFFAFLFESLADGEAHVGSEITIIEK
jgi:hypothetical protein